jgi:3-isopropylmalate/(R)-2-methylmalate dehydratase large subunit
LRIPKKKELLELQRKYRSDKKIGEVYGVPARLVGYWRSKKRIGPYSFPKYGEEKILELWERYGDDARAGAELGISAAGFRQWRRKYGISRKPLQLRLEQLELGLIDPNRKKNSRRETAPQKVLARKSGLKRVEAGQIVNVEPDLAMSHDNSDLVIDYFKQIGASRIWNPNKIIIVLDRRMPVESHEAAEAHRRIREFVKRQKIKNFYDIGEGICHQVVVENGYMLPGQLAVGTDWHATSYGCLGGVSTYVSTAEMAAIWAVGKIWLKVPSSVKILINGNLGRAVYARDIMLKLMRDMAPDAINYRALEFHGSAVAAMSVSERFTMTIVAIEMGAKSAMVPFDDTTARYLKKITKARLTPIKSDPDAIYDDEIEIDISYLTPQVGCPDGPRDVVPVEEASGKRIDHVIVGFCVNGRIDDLEITARILRGRRIHRDLRMMIVPGSRKVLTEALDRGYIKTFIESGCLVVNPGCWPCPSAHSGNLARGERVLTAGGTGYYRGNGSYDSEVYLASPATAAATALEGSIADPRKYVK